MIALLLLLVAPALAFQDEVPVMLEAPDRFLAEAGSGLTGLHAAHGAVGLGVYPALSEYHRWHGTAAGDIGLFAVDDRMAFRMGLSAQTVADMRNSISFRVLRMYWQPTARFEHRVGPGVAWVGYRHWCTHGTDDAEPGRILFRSGPEVGWHGRWERGRWTLDALARLHVTLVGQNLDQSFQPRFHQTVAGQAEWGAGDVALHLSGGLAVAQVGSDQAYDYLLWDPLGELRAEWLPAVAVGVALRGDGATGRLVVHAQRLLDSGFTRRADPVWILSLEPQFTW